MAPAGDRMRNSNWRGLCLVAGLTAGCMSSGPAGAQEFLDSPRGPKSDWQLFSGGGSSSNREKRTGGHSEKYLVVGSALDYSYDSGRLAAALRGNLRYESGVEDDTRTSVYGFAGADAHYELLPESLSWSIGDSFGQTLDNPVGPDSPQNRVNTNRFTTGPDLKLRFGSTMSLRASARYARTDTASRDPGTGLPVLESVGDDDRRSGTLGVYREFSRYASASLNASAERVEFRTPGSPGYDTRSYFFRLDTTRARSALTLDGGFSTLHDDRGRTEQMPLARVRLTRKLSPAATLNVAAGQEYRSGSEVFVDYVTSERVSGAQLSTGMPPGLADLAVQSPVSDISLRNGAMKYRHGRAALGLGRVRSSLTFSAGATRERYAFGGAAGDRDTAGANVTFSRKLRPNLTGNFGAGYDERTYRFRNDSDETTFASLGVDWRVSGHWSAILTYRYEDRNSSRPEFNYVDHTVYLLVSYGSRG